MSESRRSKRRKPPAGSVSKAPKKKTAVRRATKAASGVTDRIAGEPSALPNLGEPGVSAVQTPLAVGMVASAGGLDAFKKFFKAMPEESGMAFVLIPHLDPSRESLMAPLLAKQTRMPVAEAREGDRITANRVYVIPPNRYLAIQNGVLRLTGPVERSASQTSIDLFLRSLADDQQDRAVCIILSGTGGHGTLGLKAIKANGGMAMVQDPKDAEYDRMPESAIASGLADYILPAEKMPDALLKYARLVTADNLDTERAVVPDELSQVIGVLRARAKYDFRCYRKRMLMRRIRRRMSLGHVEQLGDYLTMLREQPAEVKQLTKDLLISVTSFFRDADMFRTLEAQVVPELLRGKGSDETVRVWVPGCATGEEAYSVAIVLLEKIAELGKDYALQVFATDIDPEALEIARRGVYPEEVAVDVSPERLARFFSRVDDHSYQVNQQVREAVLFAPQNVLTDAPFSKLDLISCRNLLIYLEPEFQEKVVALLHFALRAGGYLVLGPSETIGRNVRLFEPASKKWRIYRRITPIGRKAIDFPIAGVAPHPDLQAPPAPPAIGRAKGLAELTRMLLLEDYGPAAVVVNLNHEALYFSGPTELYLRQPRGAPTQDLTELVREGLRAKVRAAVHKALREGERVSFGGARVKRNGRMVSVRVTVRPIRPTRTTEFLGLVAFQDEAPAQRVRAKGVLSRDEESAVSHLEYELKTSREELQSTIEELESANEELKASNEEVMSMNEELQSANEELETSKEELQSLNEELTTVNSQLHDKVEELETATNDLSNLLTSTDIATVFLGLDRRIRRFTPAATRLFNLIASDIGRPVDDITGRFPGPEFVRDVGEVIRDLTPREREAKSDDGRWYIQRMMPYRTLDNRIEGVVLTYNDITGAKQVQEELRRNEERFRLLMEGTPVAILAVGKDGRIVLVNRQAEILLGYRRDELAGIEVEHLIPQRFRASHADFRSTFLANPASRPMGAGRELYALRKDGSEVPVEIGLSPYSTAAGDFVLASIIDITERKHAAEVLRHAAEELEQRVAERTRELQEETQKRRFMQEQLVREHEFSAVLLDTAPALILVRDKEARIVRFNKACEEVTGYSIEEVKGKRTWDFLVPPDEVGSVKQIFEECRAGRFPITAEVHWRHRDGSVRLISWHMTVLCNASGELQYVIGIGTDITEQRRIEQLARERERAVAHMHRVFTAEGMASVLAHELNQPLAAIAGYGAASLQRLREGGGAPDELVLDLECITAQAERAGQIIRNLRSFLGKGAAPPAPVNLHDIVKAACSLIEPEAQGHGVTIVLDLAADLNLVVAQPVPIEHVLLNLIRNSIEAIRDAGMPSGTVTIETRAQPSGDTEVTVRDTGPGLDAAARKRIFEPFYTSRTDGLGLGLSISRSIIEAQGGKLWADTSPNGAVFRFTVPLAP